MYANSTQTCRLCLKSSENLVNVFDNFRDSTIASILSHHFWFEVCKDDGFSECICQLCWTNLREFHNFYMKVEVLHRDYQNSIGCIGTDIIKSSELIKQERCESPREPTVEPDLYIIKYEEPEPILDVIDFQVNKQSSNNIDDYISYDQSENASQSSDDDTQTSNKRGKADVVDDRSKFSEIEYKISKEEDALEGSLNSSSTELNSRYKKDRAIQDVQIREYFDMKCDICSDIEFTTFSETRQHYRNVHKINGYLKCCSRRFHRRYTLLNHIRFHLNPDAYRCDPCGRRFHDKNALKSHIDNHAPIDSRAHKCDLCTKSFTKAATLRVHVRIQHSSEKGESFPCDKCNKRFPTKVSLTSHIRGVHVTSLAFVCDTCARAFKTKTLLQKHMEQHSTITRPKVQCNICGAWLKHDMGLRKHLRRHKDNYVHDLNCPICSKVVQNKDSLNSHIRNVHGERRYQCTLCDKAFMTSTILKEHVAIHTGEYLYDCPYCEKKFKSGANMHSHKKKAHFSEWSREDRKRITLEKTKDISEIKSTTTSTD